MSVSGSNFEPSVSVTAAGDPSLNLTSDSTSPLILPKTAPSEYELKMKAMRESLLRSQLQQSTARLDTLFAYRLTTLQIIGIVFSALVALGVAILCIVSFASSRQLTESTIATLSAQIAAIQSDITSLNSELSANSALAQSSYLLSQVNQSVISQVQQDLTAESSANSQLQSLLNQVNTGCGTVACPVSTSPASVTLVANSTALLVLDMVDFICSAIGSTCQASITPILNLVSSARNAQVPIIYSTVANAPITSTLANVTGDIVINTNTADKYFNTDLESVLASKNVTKVIITGTASNGAVLYTVYETALRGYSVIVPTDAISAASGYITQFVQFQLLNAPGEINSNNDPNGIVTLSSTQFITFT
eukprot:TRINITY_DN21505_c0_g1_i1.p1 TRINITY_DN21505_c0_g1~~TRINITY_DN21505_c0_g1_i1.p1  ORF type:complete len:365 (-),score=93.54 TRINITY_DN21505_c0_g1_i1:16-1110(-)